ncbi:MAG: FtsH protease activity modulator HflK [Limnobacter sp.]|nr:FtsH protease activity modulator HflK [Limnobacter sp.]
MASGSNDGPPDLDELWKDFNNRINRIFGKKTGGPRGPLGPVGGGHGGSSGFPGAGKGLGALAVVGVLVWLASGFFIIEEGSAGVVTQFGEYHHTAPPGFQWRLPYPIQNHEEVNVSRVRIVEAGYRNTATNKVLRESLMLTNDENIIDIQFAVQYRLNDPKAYLFNNRNPDETVKQAAETAIREVVGKNRMDYVLYEGREDVALKTRAVIQEIVDKYKVGILINGVTVQNVQPPEQVQAAFDDAVKAGQDRARMKNEGQAYANDVIPRARGMASRLMEEAQGYRERVVAQADVVGSTSQLLKAVVDGTAKEYIVDIVRTTRPKDPMFKKLVKSQLENKIAVGASPRAEIWILRTAQVKGSGGRAFAIVPRDRAHGRRWM